MPEYFESWRCDVCRQKSLRRVKRPFEYEVSHDGRPPVKIQIPDLEVIACTNPACKPEDPGDTIIHDDAATARITEETYRQLGLLTPAEIRAGREELGLTQQQLQELLGLGGNSLSRWENGHIYQARSLDTLLRIAFGVPDAMIFLKGRESARRARKFQYLTESPSDARLSGPGLALPARFWESCDARSD